MEGGSFPTKSTKGNVIIDWGNTNAKARVRLLTTDKRGCIGDTTALLVKINVKLEPILPIGLDSLCSSEIANVPYMVYLNPHRFTNGALTIARSFQVRAKMKSM